MHFLNLVATELFVTTLCLCIWITSGFQYNGSCSVTVECLPRETYMRCVKGRCLCAADSEYDFINGYCRLKVNVRCHLTGKNIQPCVKDAFCDPPTFANGQIIYGSISGNCKCYRGESNEEDGTCSGASSLQRSFGHSSIVVSASFNTVVLIVSLCATGFGFCWISNS